MSDDSLQGVYTFQPDSSLQRGRSGNGPGKCGQANIYMLHVRGGPGVWEGKNCTFVFTRLDASGVDGTVACTAGGGDAPFTDMKFTASPG
jgi:hypothetical protein